MKLSEIEILVEKLVVKKLQEMNAGMYDIAEVLKDASEEDKLDFLKKMMKKNPEQAKHIAGKLNVDLEKLKTESAPSFKLTTEEVSELIDILYEDTLFEEGKKKKNKDWINKAIKHPGSLRATAKKMGLVRNDDENLSQTDLDKLEKSDDPKTARRARLAKVLKNIKK